MAGLFSAESDSTGPVAVDRVERLRLKYRFGESLRAVYRVHAGARTWLVSSRTRLNGPGTIESSPIDPCGPLRGAWHSHGAACDFWTFPNDRRGSWAQSLADSEALVARVFPHRQVSVTVRAVSPERAVIARVVDTETHETVAYLKMLRAGAAAYARAMIEALHETVAIRPVPLVPPRLLCVDRASVGSAPTSGDQQTSGDTLLIEPVSGTHLHALKAEHLEGAFRSLGESMAALHSLPAPPWLPSIDSCGPERRLAAESLVRRARPSLAPVARRLASRLDVSSPPPAAPVWVHGDMNALNWLVAGDRVHLIDFDQAGRGPAAADIGGVLAWMCTKTVEGHWSLDRERHLQRALFDGYARVRPLPSRAELTWFRSAALLVERVSRAISRYRTRQLAHLPAILAAAEETEALADA